MGSLLECLNSDCESDQYLRMSLLACSCEITWLVRVSCLTWKEVYLLGSK